MDIVWPLYLGYWLFRLNPLLIRNVDNLVVLDGATAYKNNLEAVIAVNMETSTPTVKTRAKPVTTEVEPK